MGVRFECPAGHKLNVKTELVGQRGICPECGARFIVPREGGGRVAPAEPAITPVARNGSATPPRVATTATFASAEPFPSPALPPSFAPPDSLGDETEWFIRTAAGQQFGPATTDAMTAWFAEGRIPDDGWLWRTGWADWRPARDARSQMTPPQAAPPATPSPPPAFGSDEFDADVDWPTVDTSVAGAPIAGLDAVGVSKPLHVPRRATSGKLVALLAVIAIALLAAMIYVLNRDPTSPAPRSEAKTQAEAASTPVADSADADAGEAAE